MKSCFLLILFILLNLPSALSQSAPDGYILQYGQKFGNNKGLADFSLTDPGQWTIPKQQGNYYLMVSPGTSATPEEVSLPPNRAILKNRIFGDFILETDVMPVASGAVPREVCIFLGMKDSTKYYLILLSSSPADARHGIYLVKNSNCIKLPLKTPSFGSLTVNEWQKIRVERDIVRRTIRVFAGTMEKPVMEVKDYELIMGSIGFGSLSSSVRFDNVSIWAPTMIQEE